MTYVMSDLHGVYDKYTAMLEKIGFCADDQLYIIGDVCDRGEKPMEILLDMMNRANVYPIMGNHDLIALNLLKKVYKSLCENDGMLEDEDIPPLLVWFEEGGKPTVSGFYRLDADKQENVLNYLKKFAMWKKVDVGEKTFVMVHAGLGNYAPDKKLDDYTDDELLFCRPDPSVRYFDDESVFTVMGHTPTPHFTGKPEICKSGRNIFIDCGAVSSKGRLACLCLETLEEFYV